MTEYVPAPAAVQKAVDCAASLDGLPEFAPNATPSPLAGSVPEGFVPVKAVVCTAGDRGANGMPSILQEELSGNFAPLLAALSAPSLRGDGGTACPAIGFSIPGLWLVNAAGEAVHIIWPTDACGMPLETPSVSQAISGLAVEDAHVAAGPGQGK
ncbi:hypothetical protein JOF48_000035 [Arthrobacter stackebrandtii]|uniref:Uncharacterized protein n=1 Tax=Arthrobacter stackebrandtii TaxID=272161 RepID=A0ABS4YR20_9MICC|nr:hypothetical protein [Arthrobacter stackebrandtii]MBP2411236.1 hypothetical protein [Arthrobacter stackebrandtii]